MLKKKLRPKIGNYGTLYMRWEKQQAEILQIYGWGKLLNMT